MSAVAKSYGISDVALANICRKLNIPRPSNRYWGRLKAGHSVEIAKLPALAKGAPNELIREKWVMPAGPPPTAAELEFRARPEFNPAPLELPFKLEVTPLLERPHRMVVTTGLIGDHYQRFQRDPGPVVTA